MTSAMTTPPKAARFWNLIARKYARDPVADQAAYERKLDETAKRMTPDMDVLEFGCGTGTTALIHSKRVKHIDAVDFSYRMIEIARGKAQGVDNVDFHVSANLDWSLREPYDMVMAHSILHLVEDLDAELAHIHTHLKPGGYFVSSTVCLAGMNGVWKTLLSLGGRLGLLPKVRFLSVDGLIAEIGAAGFMIEWKWQPKAQSVFIIARKK